MAPRMRCPVCRSKRWHKDSLSGSIVCEEGHLLQGYVQESTETQEGPSQYTQTTRRIRKNKGRKQKPPSNDHFHGDRARFAVYQAMQLIFREQLRVVIDELGWPAEIEPVARDLWAMLVASSQVPPAPRDFDKGEEPAGSYSGPRAGDRYTKSGRRKKMRTRKKRGSDDEGEEEDGEAEDGSAGGAGGGAGGTRAGSGANGAAPAAGASGATTDTERQSGGSSDGGGSSDSDGASSTFSFAGDDVDGGDADDERAPSAPASRPGSPSPPPTPAVDPPKQSFLPPPKRPTRAFPHQKRTSTDVREAPKLEVTLLLLYLSCIALRLPVFLADVFHLAETHQIPFLSALLHLPSPLQSHLSGPNRAILSPSAVPTLYPLPSSSTTAGSAAHETSAQATLARLVAMYKEDWSVEFPEANVVGLVGRVVQGVGLPPLASHLTLSLLPLVPPSTSFRLADSLTLTHERRSFFTRRERGENRWPYYAPGGQQDWRTALPEVKVASLVVVVSRLLYGLQEDDDARPPLGDYASHLPPRDRWLSMLVKLMPLEKPGDLSGLWSGGVEEMLPDEIDAYLDFFEEKMVSGEKVPSRMIDLSRFFRPPESFPSTFTAPSPASYLAQLDALLASPSPPLPSHAAHSGSASLPPLLSPTGQPLDPSTLPAPLHTLLTTLSSAVLPPPTSLPVAFTGPFPSPETSSASYLAGLAGQVEGVLSSAAASNARGEEEDEDLRTLERSTAAERKAEHEAERRRRKEMDELWRAEGAGPRKVRERERKQAEKAARAAAAAVAKGKRKRTEQSEEAEDEEEDGSGGEGATDSDVDGDADEDEDEDLDSPASSPRQSSRHSRPSSLARTHSRNRSASVVSAASHASYTSTASNARRHRKAPGSRWAGGKDGRPRGRGRREDRSMSSVRGAGTGEGWKSKEFVDTSDED
ncbi:hypothetical protein JCM10213_007851 [Rhodosporidiobolus nylandii]